MSDAILGYEDIHRDEPYIDAEEDEVSGVAHVFMFYVPPRLRGQGIGRKVFNEWVGQLPPTIKRVRLKSATLGGSDSMEFWKSFGFTHAFCGELHDEIDNTLVLGVNGYSNPLVEQVLKSGDEYRYWLEGPEDAAHLEKYPQTLKLDFEKHSQNRVGKV